MIPLTPADPVLLFYYLEGHRSAFGPFLFPLQLIGRAGIGTRRDGEQYAIYVGPKGERFAREHSRTGTYSRPRLACIAGRGLYCYYHRKGVPSVSRAEHEARMYAAHLNVAIQRAPGLPAIWFAPSRPSERRAFRRKVTRPGESLASGVVRSEAERRARKP